MTAVKATGPEGLRGTQFLSPLAQPQQVEEEKEKKKPSLVRRVFSLFSSFRDQHVGRTQEFHNYVKQLNAPFKEETPPTRPPAGNEEIHFPPLVRSSTSPAVLPQQRQQPLMRPLTQIERIAARTNILTPGQTVVLLSMFPLEDAFAMRGSLYRYLSGEEVRGPFFAEPPSIESVERGLRNTMSGYVLATHGPHRAENQEAWVSLCLRGIALAREQIRERNFRGTKVSVKAAHIGS